MTVIMYERNNILTHLKKCLYLIPNVKKYRDIGNSESFYFLSRVQLSSFNCIFTVANKVKMDIQQSRV